MASLLLICVYTDYVGGFPVSICSLYIVLGFSSFLQAVPTQPLNFSLPSLQVILLRHVQPAAYGHVHFGIGLSAARHKTVNLIKMCLVFVLLFLVVPFLRVGSVDNITLHLDTLLASLMSHTQK